MSLILKYLGQSVKFLPKILKIGSIGLAGVFVMSTFVFEIFTKGFPQALYNLLRAIFGAELVINSEVTNAIMNVPEYNLHAFLSIIASVLIVFSVIRWIGIGFKKLFNANSGLATLLSGIIVFVILSTFAIFLFEKSLGFIPLYNSIWYLLYNINPVINNIF